ncbi:S41 family peptidase [Pedobacter sp. SYP-B3415]|uniref:S41 family peptidase n=1 Tax=Pedobacter sp. SYP-B3415 TaxID=2496641 RepID=UPI00101DFB0C|nr:S41 family peptidase [Pedobacter sp. SYP-B3415]
MKRNTRINLLISLSYSLVLILGMFMGYKFLKDQGYVLEKRTKYADNSPEKVDEILHIINGNYVDDVDTRKLANLPLDSVLHRLDPHSSYLPPTKALALAEDLEGNFEGIGVEYYILKDTLLVTGVVKDGPAWQAGIQKGDKILKVDTMVISGRNLPREKMTGRFKGRRGTTVKLTLLHPGNILPSAVNVTRGSVRLSSIDAAYMLNPETGYVRISKFGAQTDQDFADAAKMLRGRGMRKLVLDLRDNGGGYLMAATGLADQFLPENKLIVYTEGRHEPRTEYFSTGTGEFTREKLAVLINENSASASEIVAGAMQDLKRGVIIGRRSFGKGLVQEQFPFNDGSALNLTIARYYTPSGRSIQKSYRKGFDAYRHEVEERLNNGELTADVSASDTLPKATMQVPIPKKFMPGGILPDVFVKLDTSGYNKAYVTLLNKKIITDYVLEVLASRYNKAYVEANLDTFSLNDAEFKDFVKYLRRNQIKLDFGQLNNAKALICNDLRALLYRYHLGDAGYYRALNANDAVIKQAMASLQ